MRFSFTTRSDRPPRRLFLIMRRFVSVCVGSPQTCPISASNFPVRRGAPSCTSPASRGTHITHSTCCPSYHGLVHSFLHPPPVTNPPGHSSACPLPLSLGSGRDTRPCEGRLVWCGNPSHSTPNGRQKGIVSERSTVQGLCPFASMTASRLTSG